MKYIIGVDSGGTSTTAVAYDISGNPLFNAEGGFGNLLNNQEQALSALEEALYQELQIDSPLALAKFVYQSSKDQISKLSLLISEYADKGDQQASRILETAGEALGEQTLLLLNKLEITENPIVAVTGSVLTKNEIVFETFKKTILALHPTCEFIRKDVSNTLGGFYFARRQNSF